MVGGHWQKRGVSGHFQRNVLETHTNKNYDIILHVSKIIRFLRS